MSHLNRQELAHLAKLCRIRCSEEELQHLLVDISKVLDYVEQLEEVDTTGVQPCTHVLDFISNVFREDDNQEVLLREDFLKNSPSHIGGMVRVPNIL